MDQGAQGVGCPSLPTLPQMRDLSNITTEE